MSKDRSPRVIIERWFKEVWAPDGEKAARELMSPISVGHLEFGIEAIGYQPFLEFHRSLLKTMPDLRVEIIKMMAEGDLVVTHWIGRGTHRGSWMGSPPTGKPVEFEGSTWFRVVDGFIVEGWDHWNQGRLLMQLSATDNSR